MSRLHHYEGEVLTVGAREPVCRVADKMDLYAVGCAVVVDAERHPVGIVTDRDLLRRVIAPGQDPEKTTAGDVMTTDLETAAPDEPLGRILDRMRERSVRRIPIVHEGAVVGLVAFDDVVAQLGQELGDLRRAIRTEVLGARQSARSRRRREQIEETLEALRLHARELGSETREWLAREIETLGRRLGGS